MREDHVVAEVLGSETPIAPSDLYNTSFKKVLHGYSKAQVDAFLRRVGDVLENLIKQVRDLKASVEEQKALLADYRARESTLHQTLVSSQKFNETIRESARCEADAIRAEARAAKARAEIEAARMPEALREEIGRLKAERSRLRADLEAVLEAHRRLVERIPAGEAPVNVAIPGESEPAPDGALRLDSHPAPDLASGEQDPLPARCPKTGTQLELETPRAQAPETAPTARRGVALPLTPVPEAEPAEAAELPELGPEPWLEGGGQTGPKEESTK